MRAAVEEEERQSAAAAGTDAAKDAIVTAEVSHKSILGSSTDARDVIGNKGEDSSDHQRVNEMGSERVSDMDPVLATDRHKYGEETSGRGYDSVADLPIEFYHYYHGSSNDMGTLIEVILSITDPFCTLSLYFKVIIMVLYAQ